MLQLKKETKSTRKVENVADCLLRLPKHQTQGMRKRCTADVIMGRRILSQVFNRITKLCDNFQVCYILLARTGNISCPLRLH